LDNCNWYLTITNLFWVEIVHKYFTFLTFECPLSTWCSTSIVESTAQILHLVYISYVSMAELESKLPAISCWSFSDHAPRTYGFFQNDNAQVWRWSIGMVEVICFWFSARDSKGKNSSVNSCLFRARWAYLQPRRQDISPKRTRLTTEKFEQLVFIMGNKCICWPLFFWKHGN